MISHVILQFHDRGKTFLADGALDGLLGAVEALVAGEVARLAEGLSAEVADEGTLVGVCAHVDFEAGFGDVTVLTDLAGERAFT